MYTWIETTAGRGANEMSSCILKWINERLAENPIDVLVIFADNCPSQCKNKIICALAMHLVHCGRVKQVEWKYLLSGHSFLPCDQAFGLIEKQIKYVDLVWSLDDYVTCMENASVVKPFIITVMTREDFFNFLAIINDKRVVVKNPKGRLFSKASQIVISNTYPEGYILKDSFEGLPTEGQRVRMMQGKEKYTKSAFDLSDIILPLRHNFARQLQAQKVTDLSLLLNMYHCPEGRIWMENIIDEQKNLLSGPHRVVARVEDDLEDDILDYVEASQES
jgi:hypothetical protein